METKAEVCPAFGEHLAEFSLCLKFDFDQLLSSCEVTVAGIEKVLNSLQTTGKQQVSNRKIFICATSAALLSRGLITSAKHNSKKRNLKVVQYWGYNL